MKYNFLTSRLNILYAILIVSIFIIDIFIPLGVAGGVPYITVILFSLWSKNRNTTIYLAVICSVMTLLGFYFSPPGGELWKVISNRLLALFSIWVTATLTLKWKKHEEELFLLNAEIDKEKEKEKIYLATIQGTQHIVNNLLNELKLVEFEIQNHPAFDKEVSSLFKDSLNQAHTLVKSLSSVDIIDGDTIRKSISSKTDA